MRRQLSRRAALGAALAALGLSGLFAATVAARPTASTTGADLTNATSTLASVTAPVGAVTSTVGSVTSTVASVTSTVATVGATATKLTPPAAALVPNLSSLAAKLGDGTAGGFTVVKFPQPQPACTGVGFNGAHWFDALDCGFGYVAVGGTTATSTVTVDAYDGSGAKVSSQQASYRSSDQAWEFEIVPQRSWRPGTLTYRVSAGGKVAGSFELGLNALGAELAPTAEQVEPGEAIPLTGRLFEQDDLATSTNEQDVAGRIAVSVRLPGGSLRGPYEATANAGGKAGAVSLELPAAATQGVKPTKATNYRLTLGLVADATYADPLTGDWAATGVDVGTLTLSSLPEGVQLENSFVSSVGWVKPGDTYVGRIFLRNYQPTAATGRKVTLPAVDGMAFTQATADRGSAAATAARVTWTGDVPAATKEAPGLVTIIVEAKAKTTGQDPQIVWKNLSTTATLEPGGTISVSHGPKVIPPGKAYDTARYGDRPFPVVPVDYADRSHESAHTGTKLQTVIDDPEFEGSTFNLYQEMSFGQLFPAADVPSAGIASAGWDVTWHGSRKASGFQFSQLDPQGTCHGVTLAGQQGTPLYPQRIKDGWYQLPGTTDYYGDDKYGSAIVGASVPGAGMLMDIDSACGPTAKAVYDAAQIADPEIDYSDFDTDKDGVVDFFMMVFTGLGGNGDSQVNGTPSYDNIWPHSSDLEFYYTDPATGLKGYVSDDQLRDYEDRPLFYADASRTTMTTAKTAYPVYVRVGPYNVNPESAIDHASVISHEYGHSLGLPDFYSLGSRETYGSWMLMASDYSQNMDVFGKQELGWLVPRVLQPGKTTVDLVDGKRNTHRIDWVQPDGTPYTLTGDSVDNGQGYVAKLPSRQIISPEKLKQGASGDHVWWSQSGNDFGCAPSGGHNLDVALPQLASVPAGTPVKLTFKAYWQMEWDFDYGFVLTSTDGGQSYQSHASDNGYTTPAGQNPNTNACQGQYGNGITGSSGSYAAGTQTIDRVAGSYPDGPFVQDSYDLSDLAGKAAVLRFSYATDPGVAKQGWFVDDVTVTAGGKVIYSSDFESGQDDPALANGGCQASGLQTAQQCTDGWQYVSAAAGSTADHAYYLELRDRSGFDLDGHGQADRGPITFQPGLYLMYTDEAHGYGNVGTDDPPAQTPLDQHPEPGSETPNLDDAAFNQGESFSDGGAGHVDNYLGADGANWTLKFDCLSFAVDRMAGDGVGPATAPGDLSATVSFTLGAGCGAFDHGYGKATANARPTAVAQARPWSANVNQPVRFDGSGSSDDRDAPGDLTYRWDFGDGAPAADGQSVSHAYARAGTFAATLTVTDKGGLSSTATVAVAVAEGQGSGGTATSSGSTGGGGGGSATTPHASPHD
jgi:M6 family metalloprotease-like protein